MGRKCPAAKPSENRRTSCPKDLRQTPLRNEPPGGGPHGNTFGRFHPLNAYYQTLYADFGVTPSRCSATSRYYHSDAEKMATYYQWIIDSLRVDVQRLSAPCKVRKAMSEGYPFISDTFHEVAVRSSATKPSTTPSTAPGYRPRL